MGLTKFQIKIDRSVYEVLCKMISYAAASVDVIDLSTLFIKETLEDFKRRFDSKKFKLQERFAFSFNSVELYVFCKYVGEMMEVAGPYERAVYRLLFETQLQPQISHEVQIRLNYNLRTHE